MLLISPGFLHIDEKCRGFELMHIALIQDLLKGPLPPGSTLLVEYDPTSTWYQASLSIAAEWLRTGGVVSYHVSAQPPENIRSRFTQMGLDVEKLEANEKLRVFDWYTATLGRKSNERYAFYSLKAADLSVLFAKYLMASPDSDSPTVDAIPPQPSPDWLRITDDVSCLARFNVEKSWVEFVRTRMIPIGSLWKSTGIVGIMRGIHSDWAYKNLEAASDSVIDFKLDETGDEATNLIRIRNMRLVGFDSKWHALMTRDNLEVAFQG
jgi:KaiC/GvpD/RAD55 family RecA-like ATPase